MPTKNNLVVAVPNKIRCINPHVRWGTTEGYVFISSVMCCAT